MRLAVISHVGHVRDGEGLWAYGPYVIEMDEWARLFDEVVIVAPERAGPPRGDERRFAAGNVRLAAIPERGGAELAAKAGLVLSLPRMAAVMVREMRRADVVQVRCPGNAGLVGVLLAPVFAKRMIAKYAGQWSGYPGEALSYRMQRRLLGSAWWRGPVLAYTGGEKRQGRVAPMFNSVLTAEDLERARAAALRKREDGPWRVLYVGRLSRAKGADVLLRACASLRRRGLDVVCEIVGEGPEREALEALARELGLSGEAVFHGGRPFAEVMGFYERADVLALPSQTEGWPKVLAEAMAFGVPCVATRGGLTERILGEQRGLCVDHGDVEGLAEAIRTLSEETPEKRAGRRAACAAWGQKWTLEGVRERIREVMEEAWGVRLGR